MTNDKTRGGAFFRRRDTSSRAQYMYSIFGLAVSAGRHSVIDQLDSLLLLCR